MSFFKWIKNWYYIILKVKSRLLVGRPVLVLMYHRINDEVGQKLTGLTVSVATFDEQLQYFKKNFQIVRLDEDWTSLKKTGLVITFDDGYADNLWNALPLLEKHGIPATLFVTTLNSNTTDEFWWDRLVFDYYAIGDFYFMPSFDGKISKKEYNYDFCVEIVSKLKNEDRNKWFLEFEFINTINYNSRETFRSLTEAELKLVSEHPLINIGFHTHHHYALGELSFKEQKNELLLSIQHLEKRVSKTIKYLALPFGSYNKDTLVIAEEIGFKGVLLANDYYSNKKNKVGKKINRILMPNIKDEALINRLKKFDC
jgi:peptidoglycan/xylan/chitin deacetylase (PgdA/CDA1 family)